MKESQKEEYSNNKREVFKDEITKCFELIKEQGDYSIDREINMESLVKKAIMKGLKIEDINNTIKHYANLDVIMIMPSGNLKFV